MENYKNWKNKFKDYGIDVYVHSKEKRHNEPHLHCIYAEYEISLRLPDLEILAGSIPKNKLKQIKKILQDNSELVKYLLTLYKSLNKK